MKRLHLFEFEDQSWFPDVIRQGITDYLQFASNRMNLYQALLPVIKKGLEQSGNNTIVDICSGGGGGIFKIHQQLKESGTDYKITLTDKFPNVPSFQYASEKSEGKIDFVDTPVDATNVPSKLRGFRTQFISFHHFKPPVAQRILSNAVHARTPIAIFEVTERTLGNLIAMLFTPFVVMAAMLFIRPVKWTNLFFTFVLPLIPLCTMWDGIVSVLRSYKTDELKAMAEEAGNTYHWETKKINLKGAFGVTYLLGYPESAEDRMAA